MKRASVIKWFVLASILVAVVMIGYFLLRGTGQPDDPSIMMAEPFRTVHGRIVENGSAFDKAAVDIGTATRLVLPHDAVVRRQGEAGKVQFFMMKTLAFGGHPPEPMSIRDARKDMGCAVKTDGDALVITTFGEWDSHKEGGARMKLVVLVPEEVEIEQRNGLSGEGSAGREWHGQYLTKPKDAKGGYWYGPASPAEGWRAVPDVPDPDRTAG
jgi:hypothetical protein